jgi:hypothetical protein
MKANVAAASAVVEMCPIAIMEAIFKLYSNM